MCGIFGAIGTKINSGTIRALALANRERGTDSLGFFSSSGKFVKRADDPLSVLGDRDIAEFIDRSCSKGWFIAGHTRAASHGSVIDRNAHPFRYGRYIGIHNGIVQYPHDRKYQVDSEYLIDSLKRSQGDYQSGFADIAGYWGLAWFDGSEFYLQAHRNEVAIGCDDHGTFYFSSDFQHLDACVIVTGKMRILSNGATIRFNCKSREYAELPPFVSKLRDTSTAAQRALTSGKSVVTGSTVYPLPATVAGYAKPGKKSKRSKRNKQRDFGGYDPVADKWDDPFYYEDDARKAWDRAADWEAYSEEFN